ncbi:diguanylate cyclase domain-containing protein [Pseudodesulfovibrio senegalensis]|uniref:diguanylate cyclase n=1 Tax=Pseudodesulfovibrio senegalensis TaxID=1721087 RepID=A0A6N6N2H8_9BACT|nr:diguanylate cyclase [Pseudodesulfovibrio senegalensis]KAB1442219.1 diguanylate cyclase [Pseudodesulfovibrio senegalensis]
MAIIIVDDTETSRNYLEILLRNDGLSDLVTCESYDQTRAVLDACPQSNTTVALIIMDINMPGTDGIEATRRIKVDPAYSDVPIIMVSAMTDETILEQAFEVGATDYISKPVNRVELRARVRAALRLFSETEKRKKRERELERLTAELQELSHHDGLTGVPNRRWLDATLEKEWKRALREEKPLSIMITDIDFFKNYNDSLGHLQGDSCLKGVAECIRRSIRRPADFMARYGGEEFMVVLPDTTSKGAQSVAVLIQYNLERSDIAHPASTISDRITVSTGIATATPSADSNPQDLVALADKMLYQAKNKGRNRIEMMTV